MPYGSFAMIGNLCLDSPIALVRRFDRNGDIRIPYILLIQHSIDRVMKGGTDIPDVIRQTSKKPADDLQELWLLLRYNYRLKMGDH